MGHPFDPADVEPDDSIVALLNALADMDADPDRYLPTEEELAHAQRLVRLEFDLAVTRAAGDPNDPDDGTDVLTEVIVGEIESWLANAPVDEVRARGPMSVPTVDRVIPELAEAGYAADVEIDADVDSNAVSVSVQLTAAIDNPARLVVRVVDSIGVVHSARINRYGLATITGVPRGPFRIRWSRVN